MAKRRSSRPATRKNRKRLRVGDRVSFMFGIRRVYGVVVEDRGPLGGHGRRLLAVRSKLGGSEPTVIELPVDELRAA
jgi:hypothetical protein